MAAWLIEPSAQPEDSAWQGRDIYVLLVRAESPAFARLEADRWAAATGALNPQRPGFEDANLYHVRAAPTELARDLGKEPVTVVERQGSGGASNSKRPAAWRRASPPGKTVTTGKPGGDVDDLPGANAASTRDTAD